MSDLLSIGSSALLAYRQALDTAGHNIANVNTPGYTRQRVEISATPGAGVSVRAVNRLTDDMLASRVLGDASSFSRLDIFNRLATQLDGVLSDADAGLAKPLQEFFTALNGVAASPNSTAARQVLLSRADSLAARFGDLQSQLDTQSAEVGARLTQATGEINQYASAVAQLNQRIALATGGGGPAPNDLLDQRDQLVNEISNRVGISTVKQADGTLNLFLGSGQALVLGEQTYALATAPDAYNSGALEITAGGVPITAQLSGGTIGGLLDYRREILTPALNQLGRLAVGMSTAINAQHVQGADQNGMAGSAFFAPLTGTALASGNNSGSAAVTVGFSAVGQLSGEDYELQFNGSWQLSSRRSGQSISLSGSGSVGDPLTGAGLSLVISGSPVAGDRFLVQPTRNAAGDLRLALSDTAQIAAAAAGAPANSSDNSNARALAGLSGLSAGYTSLVAQAGTQAQSAQMARDAAAAIQQGTLSERDSVSGVNLDEEAADLIRYQQAYQAAAQIIQTANTLFQTLLDAARR